MKIISMVKNGDGSRKYGFIADTGEDMWAAYNLIEVGDKVTASAVRKVARDGAPGSASEKVRTTLALEVTSTNFDPDTGNLRVGGRNAEENRFVRMGAHHTLDLEVHQPFWIEKFEWDSVHLKRIEEAKAATTANAEIAAVVMDVGLANVCIVTESMTLTRAKVEQSVPKKRPGASGHEKGMTRFHEAVLAAILRVVDFSTIKVVVIASPAFVKDDFYTYMMSEAARRDIRPVIENKNKFVLAHAASGHKRALSGVFMDPTVMSKMSETRAAAEVDTLNQFFKALALNSSKAYYGYRHVRLAADRGAIETLLVSDALLRVRESKARHAYVSLIEDVNKAGGAVRMFSSMHVSGEQLTQMSGIAALLRFPIEDIDEASLPYARAAAEFARATGMAGGPAEGDEEPRPTGANTFDVEYDSDGSSDSDASYRVAAAGAGKS